MRRFGNIGRKMVGMIAARSCLRRDAFLQVITKAVDELKGTKNVALQKPIVKNCEPLPTNADSLQRWAIVSDGPILYNNK
jgi:hypothetical protein